MRLETRLRTLGFRNDLDVKCRWKFAGIVVDIMPTDESILGFSNVWYVPGMASAEKHLLPNGTEIRVFKLPYFLASKAAAFQGRGNNDFQGSKDFEDLITVIDARPQVLSELAPYSDVTDYLREVIAQWEKHPNFLENIMGQLPSPKRNVGGARRVLDVLRSF